MATQNPVIAARNRLGVAVRIGSDDDVAAARSNLKVEIALRAIGAAVATNPSVDDLVRMHSAIDYARYPEFKSEDGRGNG